MVEFKLFKSIFLQVLPLQDPNSQLNHFGKHCQQHTKLSVQEPSIVNNNLMLFLFIYMACVFLRSSSQHDSSSPEWRMLNPHKNIKTNLEWISNIRFKEQTHALCHYTTTSCYFPLNGDRGRAKDDFFVQRAQNLCYRKMKKKS